MVIREMANHLKSLRLAGAVLTALIVFGLSATAKPNDDLGPPIDDGPVSVYVRVFVIDIDGIDTAEQNFSANVFFDLRWNDPRLKHRSKSDIIRPLMEVWNPWPQIVNRQRTWPTLPNVVRISQEGDVVYKQRVWGQFSQPLHLRDFPFDDHSFGIIVASVGSTSNEVTFLQEPGSLSGIADELSLPDFRVTDSRLIVDPYQPVPDAPAVSAIRFEFDATRESGYYIAKVMVPLILIVAMSWIVFWVDPKEAGTQIGLGATAMLTLIAYRFAIDGSLPKVAYLTRMDIFILASTILVFASLLEVVLTSYLARTDKLAAARWIDRLMRVAFPLAFVLLTLHAFVM